MLTKAIIVEIIDPKSIRVRIPILHQASSSPTAVPNSALPIATVCTYPGVHPGYAIGDVVFVDFEEGVYSQPVILGLLYTDAISNSTSDFHANTLLASSIGKIDTNKSISSVVIKDIAPSDDE